MEGKVVSQVVDHLIELRRRIMTVTFVFILAMIAGFILAPRIINYVKLQPMAGGIDWNVFAFTDGIVIYMKCALLFALLITLPLLLQQAWKFSEPGLTQSEAAGTKKYIPISFVLFLCGVVFAYYLIFPMMINFLSRMNQSIGATEVYGLTNYFTLMFNLVLPIAIMFEMPVIILFLTRLGILTPERLKTSRKYAYLVLVIIGAMISPPDLLSNLSVMIPLIILFEISLICSRVYTQRLAKKSRGME